MCKAFIVKSKLFLNLQRKYIFVPLIRVNLGLARPLLRHVFYWQFIYVDCACGVTRLTQMPDFSLSYVVYDGSATSTFYMHLCPLLFTHADTARCLKWVT